MNNTEIKDISRKIVGLCYDINRNIASLPEKNAISWAKGNSIRHAITIKEILNYARLNKKTKLKILNAGGIADGNQDFSILYFLRNFTNLRIEWDVLDSPNNPFLKKELFQKFLSDLKVNIKLVDFNKNVTIKKKYDIILFTEIAEHLDHSVLLKTFRLLNKSINSDSIVLITTPNLVSITNRIRLLFGDGHSIYFGEGHLNLNKGWYGHIGLYDLKRLVMLLEDAGFEICKKYTFNWGLGSLEIKIFINFLSKVLKLISLIIPNSKQNILIIAKKGNVQKIPFQ